MDLKRIIGLSLLSLSLGGITQITLPPVRLEASYYIAKAKAYIATKNEKPMPPAIPVVYNPLIQPDGTVMEPINKDFSIVIPKVGINASVMPAVNPGDSKAYEEALKVGVAHASTSFFPNEDGTVYLFSHSTNYEWFVKDLNAVFYLLKNLNVGDQIVLVYKGTLYTYKLREKRVVSPSEVSFMAPIPGTKALILQTCWPPGSTTERLLIFADFVKTSSLITEARTN